MDFAEHTVAALNLVEDLMANTFRRTTPVYIAGARTRIDEGVLTKKMAEQDLPGGRWCEECGIATNHTTADHEAAEADG